MMANWEPISEADFKALFAQQYDDMTDAQRKSFDRYRVEPWKASIKRSEKAGFEDVYVVAQAGDGVLYFDDVEFGFNISTVDRNGHILKPGGAQLTLSEAVDEWFPN